MQVFSFSPFGYEGAIVTVEVDLRRGIPAVDLVGLADNAVRESRERMRAAIRNSGFEFPQERVLISLSPADVRKEGAGFDLAIALGVLFAKDSAYDDSLSGENSENAILVMGELELSGRVRGVRGVHAALCTAHEQGITFCIIPKENEQESLSVPIKTAVVSNLQEAFHALTGYLQGNTDTFCSSLQVKRNDFDVSFAEVTEQTDLVSVVNQSQLVRALQIAAAGRHNLMVYGPPGCGKTLSLKRFSSLLPLLTAEQAQTTARIYSLAGIPFHTQSRRQAPFRVPHQSASLEGIIGGGIHCRPGEISLSHNGVLFLDEAGEFKASVLQALRVPLETGVVTVSRAGRHTTFPANFQLLMACNPCPCGNYGSDDKVCVCSMRSIEQYWKKLSAPLLDRIDIRLPVFKTNSVTKSESAEQNINDTMSKDKERMSSKFLQKDIQKAVQIQRKRQGKPNAELLPEEISKYCFLNKETVAYLTEQGAVYRFSARSEAACKKLARTIADMREESTICLEHMQEAISLRKNESGLNGFIPLE